MTDEDLAALRSDAANVCGEVRRLRGFYPAGVVDGSRLAEATKRLELRLGITPTEDKAVPPVKRRRSRFPWWWRNSTDLLTVGIVVGGLGASLGLGVSLAIARTGGALWAQVVTVSVGIAGMAVGFSSLFLVEWRDKHWPEEFRS